MEQEDAIDSSVILGLTTEIVCAYVGNNPLAASDLPNLIGQVNACLKELVVSASGTAVEKQTPAVSVRKSLGQDYLICLEDGKKFKSLKRHLRTHYDLSPDQYRSKWGLPADYPMVAPSYAEKRSRLAKEMQLGQKRKAA